MQRRTTVHIDPDDADGVEGKGHQVALDDVEAITVTVTSADGSRMRTYRVIFEIPSVEIGLQPGWTSFEWPGTDGIAIADALRGGEVAGRVVVVYEWNAETGMWLAFFPGLEAVPGINTLTTLKQGSTYWITTTEAVTWTVVRGGEAPEAVPELLPMP